MTPPPERRVCSPAPCTTRPSATRAHGTDALITLLSDGVSATDDDTPRFSIWRLARDAADAAVAPATADAEDRAAALLLLLEDLIEAHYHTYLSVPGLPQCGGRDARRSATQCGLDSHAPRAAADRPSSARPDVAAAFSTGCAGAGRFRCRSGVRFTRPP